MDSNQIRAGREQWHSRRLSQDVHQLQALLAARAVRLAPTANQTREDRYIANLRRENSQDVDYARPATGLNRPYQKFEDTLRQQLLAIQDNEGRPLYTSHQVHAQLSYSNQPVGDDDRCFGEYGSVTYFARTETGMDHLHAYVPVKNVTNSSIGFVQMDQRWQSNFDDAEVDFQWIHIPANNMEWARAAIRQILRHFACEEGEESPSSIERAAKLEDRILSVDLWENQQNVGLPELPHARFMRPFCRKVDVGPALVSTSTTGSVILRRSQTWPSIEATPDQETLANSFVLFMPYLHWETTLAYLHMKSAIRDIDAGGVCIFSPDIAKLPCGIDEKLLRHYLQHLQPVHVRRTLDQFGYYTIADTTSRDKDQVVDKYARAHGTTDLLVPPMLMVDQCWLWVIGQKTVLTCFPHRWNKNINQVDDSSDIYQNLLETLDDPLHRLTITNVAQLASLIIDRCAMNVLDRNLMKDENLRFMDFFDWSIDDLNERQSQCLQALWKDVQSSNDEAHGSLTDISKEFDILEKIKDIIDELQIILRLIDQQIYAFSMVLRDNFDLPNDQTNQASDLGETASNQNSSPNPLQAEQVDFARLRDKAAERADGIKAMIERASTTYAATLDVLSLKQQQANISEARSSRKAAQAMETMAREAQKAGEESEKQGYSIMLFTIVTIFFLPMSAVAGIFGVNAVEFGQGKIHLSTIFAYVIPISVFVVYVSFVLAFNHKARRTILLVLQIIRAYLNLAYPVVFDEHKESKLQKKLDDLKERRRQQRQRKLAKIRAAEGKPASSDCADSVTRNEVEVAEHPKNEEAEFRNSVEAPDADGMQQYESAGSGRFRWAAFNRTRSREVDSEAGGRPPSEMSSPAQDTNNSTK